MFSEIEYAEYEYSILGDIKIPTIHDDTNYQDTSKEIYRLAQDQENGDLLFNAPNLVEILVIIMGIPLEDVKDLKLKDPIVEIVSDNIWNYHVLKNHCHCDFKEIYTLFSENSKECKKILDNPINFVLTKKVLDINFATAASLFLHQEDYFSKTMELIDSFVKERVNLVYFVQLKEFVSKHPTIFQDVLSKQDNFISLIKKGLTVNELMGLIDASVSLFYYLINASDELLKQKDFQQNQTKIINEIKTNSDGVLKKHRIEMLENSTIRKIRAKL